LSFSSKDCAVPVRGRLWIDLTPGMAGQVQRTLHSTMKQTLTQIRGARQ
jgi:hypothetical protein